MSDTEVEIFEQIPSLPPSEAKAAAAPSGNDDTAHREEAAFVSGLTRRQLAEQAAREEHRRNERFRNHFEWMAIIALWLMAIAIAAIAGVWIFHLVAPPRYRWLSVTDLSHIQSIVTAGLLVGVVGNHFKKRLA